jgi:5-methylcytosine-specific restriction endonuclease McrA
MRHLVPDGDPAVVIDRALTLLVQDLERKTFAAKKERPVRPPKVGRATRAPRAERRAPRQATPAVPRPQAATPPSSSRSRRIPASVKREVWAREGGQCGFVGAAGRCQARGFLEFHHEVPFAVGGEATAANVCLRCSQHNGHEADLFFGPGTSRRRTPRAPTRSGPS